MKQILPKLEEINKYLSFAKKAFTKNGFRHVVHHIDGLITINKKTVKKVSQASVDESHHSAISRVLTEAKFGICEGILSQERRDCSSCNLLYNCLCNSQAVYALSWFSYDYRRMLWVYSG